MKTDNFVSSDVLLDQIFSITQGLYKEMSKPSGDAENDHNTIYRLLTDLGRTLVNADRASFWKWDKRNHSIWTTAAVGAGRITIPEGTGLVGKALAERHAIVTNDPYNHPDFNSDVDKKTGYVTKSILVMPICNCKGEFIGAYPAINKLDSEEGFDLEECLKNAVEIDNLIEEEIDYEFHQDLGYLTCCPSNLGTGMRASVMVHLPAHTKTGKINSVIRNFSQVGLTVRGLYGEGSKALGNIYQVSNQVTLGITEEEIIEKLTGFITELTENERKLQKELYDREKFVLEDKIMRSYGTLKNAVILSSSETLNLISDMRMGINLGIIKDITLGTLNEIFYAVLPANIIKKYNLESSAERDLKRAEIIKEKLK